MSTSSDCTNANYITVANTYPYTVFGTPYGSGCASLAISVDENGTLQSIVANATYDSSAGVHGAEVVGADGFFYSADG